MAIEPDRREAGRAPPYVFFALHASAVWPVGVVGLALGNAMVAAGVPVRQTAQVLATSGLAFALEFVWAPLTDATLTRRAWYAIGAMIMAVCLFAMFLVPWRTGEIPGLGALAFAACSGAAIALASAKGIMAWDVSTDRKGAASGFYTAGGTFGRAAAGALALVLLAHLPSRGLAAVLILAPPAIGAVTIMMASRQPAKPLGQAGPALFEALADLRRLVRTPQGALIALLCVLPFGHGTEAALIGAIAREWSVGPDLLAAFTTISAIVSTAGALMAAPLFARFGLWRTFVTAGLAMIALTIAFAFAPRDPAAFIGVELAYRLLGIICYAAILGIVITAIGQGAAATKAAVMWSLVNFAFYYPTLIEGSVHDVGGVTAMLLTDAMLGVVGLAALILAASLLRLRTTLSDPAWPAATAPT